MMSLSVGQFEEDYFAAEGRRQALMNGSKRRNRKKGKPVTSNPAAVSCGVPPEPKFASKDKRNGGQANGRNQRKSTARNY